MLGKYIRNKNILITGGTGSIGSKVLDKIIEYNPKLVKIFSRNEYKQYQMRYAHSHRTNIQYIIGDIRDYESVSKAAENTDYIFHCAALKHVPFSEEMPEEFIKTNILGSLNVMKAAIHHRVPKTISISTDKVVDPANLMGLTKAVQEKIFASHHLRRKPLDRSVFVNVRFGNVTGTHGSLFPIIYHQIYSKKPITVTHPEMTRFFISSDEAIDLILWAMIHGKNGEIIVKKMKSTSIERIINTFKEVLLLKKNWPVKQIGVRAGEKIHESLITEDNLYRTQLKNGYYVISPYKTGESIVLTASKSRLSIDQFMSNNPDNYLTDKELFHYVKKYLKDQELRNHII